LDHEIVFHKQKGKRKAVEKWKREPMEFSEGGKLAPEVILTELRAFVGK